MVQKGRGGAVAPHLLDVVARLGAGLDEHDAQLLGPLLALLNADLPARDIGKNRKA